MGKKAAQSRDLRKARTALARERGGARNWSLIIGSVIIGALIVAIIVVLVNAKQKNNPGASGKLVVPAGATAAGALTTGDAGAPVRVEIYQDYMCPACGQFEHANSAELIKLTEDKTARLEIYPLSFLDKTSQGTNYSTRAANAVATVSDRSPAKLLAFNQALYAHQPQEGSRGLSDAQIARIAKDAGVPRAAIDAFEDRTFEPWVADSTEKVFKTGITGTPTVKINGQQFKGDLMSTGPLTDAINAAKGGE